MNNTPNNNQEDFQAYSLGSINQVNVNPEGSLETQVNPIPVAPEAPIESLDMSDTVASPVSPVAPVEPVNPTHEVLEPINQFENPAFNNIGTVPPSIDNPTVNNDNPTGNNKPPKKKKGINKTTFVVVMILALIIVGSVVYVLLNQGTTSKSSVTLKEVSIEMGSVVSDDINDYAIFNNMNSSSCTLDVTNITDTNVYNAEYYFSIDCSGTKYTGKVKIVDTTAPVVEVKDVTVGLDSEVSPKAFIDDCVDLTGCTYTFKDEEKVKEYLKEENNYKVDIIVSDGAGNSIEVSANLIVKDKTVEYYFTMSKTTDTYIENIKFGVSDNVFVDTAYKIIVFDFSENEAEYTSIKETSTESDQITYRGFTGTPEFDDDAKTVTFTFTYTMEEMSDELGTALPNSVGEMRDVLSSLGYENLKFSN